MAAGLDPRGRSGGICKLLEIIEEHPVELAYDFRSKFNLSFEDIGNGVTYKEAIMLVAALLRDTSSWLQAAHAEWDHPVSREWIVLSHVYDLLAAVNSKNKPKPYPTPWPAEGVQKIGRSKQSRLEVMAALDRMNPKENDG